MPCSLRTPSRNADLFIEHNGVKVFHCYKDNRKADKLRFWYTTTARLSKPPKGCDYTPDQFDIRSLPIDGTSGLALRDFVDRTEDRRVLRAAIDAYIVYTGVVAVGGGVKAAVPGRWIDLEARAEFESSSASIYPMKAATD